MEKILNVVFTSAILIAYPSYGHHSPAAFDMSTTVEISGTISEVRWVNPHAHVTIETIDNSGRTVQWQLEAERAASMKRDGWTSSTLRSGMAVIVQVYPNRTPSKTHGFLQSLTLDNSDTYILDTAKENSDEIFIAENISGIWKNSYELPQKTVADLFSFLRSYTQAGLDAQSTYTEEEYPPAKCIPNIVPYMTVIPPMLTEIETMENRIIFKSEYYNVDRVIYMDGREHPNDGERTNQGYSIGHWEDDVLVVDTRLYEDHRQANGTGIPSGSQRRTVERFSLSEDRTQLLFDTMVEDPEFLLEPYTVSSMWSYTPNVEMARSECDLKSANTYLFQ